ncbi:AraC family transcriptional regulator [uncultured Victivallis sp.]|uniref:AraC family transcriptional regulator n=1 Tax=uncultured Victivallis sp. TaxID=354118 RepID=UPI0025FE75D2|nr:AraC family transcriptional regulator [uncultured Victivallis sp.]
MIDQTQLCREETVFPFRLNHAGWGIATTPDCGFELVDYEFCTVEYVVSGRGVLESDGRRFVCGPDSIYFLHRHGNHSYRTDPVDLWHKLFFIVDGALVDTLIACYGLSNVCQINGVPQLRPSFEAMMELGYATPAVHRRAAVIFHQFVESCSEILHERTLSARPEALELKKTIDGSIGKRFRLNAFSRQVGYSPAHLIRRFREAFGCSPYEYLMQRRIETARQLLSFSRKSVKEIAEMLGFADQYSFSGSFKARTGVSPSHYRRRG